MTTPVDLLVAQLDMNRISDAVQPIYAAVDTMVSAFTYLQGNIGSGTVTSVGLALPANEFTVTNSPVTTFGTLTGAWKNQAANLVFAGPTSGGAAPPAFRALVTADIPSGVFLRVSANLSDVANVASSVQNLGLTVGVNTEAWSASLDALAALAGTGFVAQIGANSFAERTIAVSAPLAITNPAGVAGNPSISFSNQTANQVFAGPTSGGAASPAFRALVAADIPSLSASYVPIGSALLGVQVFSASGTYTPTAGTQNIIVELWGAGAGGGGCNSGGAGTAGLGGGGASGTYMRFAVRGPANIGASQTVTIGAGGAQGANTGTDGGNGGASSFGAMASCPGGTGTGTGVATPSATAVVTTGGPRGSAPTIAAPASLIDRMSGNAGFPGFNLGTQIGASGRGGGAPFFGEREGNVSNGPGAAGSIAGGGAGGFSVGATGRPGGLGGDGYCVVWEFN